MFGKKKKHEFDLVSPDGKSSVSLSARFNWSLLLSSSVFGYPLLRLRLWDWAAAMFALSSLDIWLSVKKLMTTWDLALSGNVAALENMEESSFEHVLSALLLIGSAWLGAYGHSLCCKRLMVKGWRFRDPEDPAARAAVAKWRIPERYTGKVVVRHRRIRPVRPSDRG